jgi:hypothetical protein
MDSFVANQKLFPNVPSSVSQYTNDLLSRVRDEMERTTHDAVMENRERAARDTIIADRAAALLPDSSNDTLSSNGITQRKVFKSHSLRRGPATHAASNPDVQVQWIAEKGGWSDC